MEDVWKIYTDREKEFYNSDVQKFLKKHNINHYSTYSILKDSVVEWLNHVEEWHVEIIYAQWKLQMDQHPIASHIKLQRPQTSNYWYASRRRYLRPQVLNHGLQSRKLLHSRDSPKVGDSVRVSKFKTVFDKCYTPNWNTEIFKIIKMQQTNPVTYLLEDFCGKSIAGGFYEYKANR